nr:ribonuclease H-like domain-containing protein [Tanacetum cinerariifolium]
KPLVNVAKPRQNALQTTHSLSRRPFYQQISLKNRNLNNNVNAAKANSVNTAKGNNVTSVVRNKGINAVKHRTGNISYLTDFKEHDRGYVSFGGGAKCGKITGKGTIRTGKFDFEDVYFVKELQFNLFSVSQIASIQVSTFSTPVSTVSSHDNTFNLSDKIVYAFLENQPNESQLVHEDLEQIHEDDLEEMDVKCRTGLGFSSYNAVAPLPTGLFAPPTIDLSTSSLEEFQHPEFKGYEPKDSKSVYTVIFMIKMIQKPMLNNVEKGTVQREVRPVWNNAMRINHKNFSNSRRNFAPTAVLTKSGIAPISTAGQSSSRAAAPQVLLGNMGLMLLSPQHVGFGNQKLKYKIMSPKTVDHTFVSDLTMLIQKADLRNLSYLTDYKKHDEGYVAFGEEAKGGNISYLTDYKKHDEGYVAFGEGAKGGKITGKGTIRTGKHDFEDMHFVKELQFALFSVSQMCDKKNSILFTDTECSVS